MDFPKYCFKITLLDGAVVPLIKSNAIFKDHLLEENNEQNNLTCCATW